MIFVDTPLFTSQIKLLLTDDDSETFQRALADNPQAGDVIPGPAGCARSGLRRRVTARVAERG